MLSPNQLNSPINAQDLWVLLTDEQWEEILNNVHSPAICAKHSQLECKILHREILPRPNCPKYTLTELINATDVEKPLPTSLTFVFCRKVSRFWAAIFETLSKTSGEVII